MDSITFTVATISDYVILLLLFIYVFALMGMNFFSGRLLFNEEDQYDLYQGHPPRNNFEDVTGAIVLIFQILMVDQWNYVMYDCMRSSPGLVTPAYFIMLVLLGSIIMLNLFLAILLGNFEKARNFGQKKKVFEAFREIM